MRGSFLQDVVAWSLGILACAGCSIASNPNQAFGMTLNGGPYWANHASAKGFLVELESGMNLSYHVRIVYPLAGSGQMPMPGLEIEFDPAEIKAGKEIAFDAHATTDKIQISYYPATGHNYAEGQLLVFGLGPEGRGVITFEKIEANIGGRVKGMLQQATLYGYYESGDVMSAVTPTSPQKLELRNFSFDVVLEEGWW